MPAAFRWRVSSDALRRSHARSCALRLAVLRVTIVLHVLHTVYIYSVTVRDPRALAARDCWTGPNWLRCISRPAEILKADSKNSMSRYSRNVDPHAERALEHLKDVRERPAGGADAGR